MWIFTTGGFYSIVTDRNSSNLLVRSRVAGDIERLWPKAKVMENEGTDYRYRAVISRRQVEKAISNSIKQIDYENYKSSIEDHRRSIDYLRVWSAMAAMQDSLP